MDLTATALADGRVGIWYGAWEPADLDQALSKPNEAEQRVALGSAPAMLAWDGWLPFPKTAFDTIVRFRTVREEDWFLCYAKRVVYLVRAGAAIRVDLGSRLNATYANGLTDVFHYREVLETRRFPIDQLPDGFLLLAQAGRSNVHELRQASRLGEALEKFATAEEVRTAWAAEPIDRWLDLMGPSEWESLCMAFLCVEHQFIPTGLLTGRTLATIDIAGADRSTGQRIRASCKKDPNVIAVGDDFHELVAGRGDSRVFLFAYGGCNNPPGGVELITRAEMLAWLGAHQDVARVLRAADARA